MKSFWTIAEFKEAVEKAVQEALKRVETPRRKVPLNYSPVQPVNQTTLVRNWFTEVVYFKSFNFSYNFFFLLILGEVGKCFICHSSPAKVCGELFFSISSNWHSPAASFLQKPPHSLLIRWATKDTGRGKEIETRTEEIYEDEGHPRFVQFWLISKLECLVWQILFIFIHFSDFVTLRFPQMSQSTFCLTVNRYLGEKANAVEPPVVSYKLWNVIVSES